LATAFEQEIGEVVRSVKKSPGPDEKEAMADLSYLES
jgi:hypothetical protein